MSLLKSATDRQNLAQLIQADCENSLVEVQGLVQSLKSQIQVHQVSPATVRRFYQSIHTLKALLGSESATHPGVSEISHLEGKLACTPLIELARQAATWVPDAEKTIQKIAGWINEQEKRRKVSELTQQAGADWGILVLCERGEYKKEKATRLWIALNRVIRILSPSELRGRTAVLMDGRWVPTFGRVDAHSFGVFVNLPQVGTMVVVTPRMFRVCPREEAMQQGASLGLEFEMDQVSYSSSKSIAA